MNPLLFGIGSIFIFLVALLIAMIFIYMKHNKNGDNNGNTNTNTYVSSDDISISEDEKHDDFIKSIQVVNDERTILGTVIINGISQEVSMEKEGDGYIYYLGDKIIGGYDPDVMGDDLIVFRENTLENELSDEIKDAIEQVIEENREKEEEKQERERIEQKTKEKNVNEQE